jgi:hypothetical protein
LLFWSVSNLCHAAKLLRACPPLKELGFRMCDLRTRAAMSALIDSPAFGCQDAAAAAIEARTGDPVAKGTLSKIVAGHLRWPHEYICALEDAAGVYPVSDMRARDVAARRAARHVAAPADIVPLAAAASKEAGEAVAAAIPLCARATPDHLVSALQEAREGAEALRRLAEAIEARLRAGGDA